MKINDALVEKLALLARLRFDDVEKIEIKSDLEKMILFVEKLNELDTTGIDPLLHITENSNVFRKDEISGMCSREDALLNAPVKDQQYFKVPKVINKQ
ncbi:MAG: Asp-tRNA(Asn)/Glu-tRNA(Gln) amidotransferase subunit GatC [Ferruginibacter sp.]